MNAPPDLTTVQSFAFPPGTVDFAEPGFAVVSCGAIGGEGEWGFSKITAMRVSSLSNNPLELP